MDERYNGNINSEITMKNRNADGTGRIGSIWDEDFEIGPARSRRAPREEGPDASKVQREVWARMAVQFLRVERERRQSELTRFTAEDVEVAMLNAGFSGPDDARQWGTVFQRAKREGIITQMRFKGVVVTAPTAAKHRTPVWIFCRG